MTGIEIDPEFKKKEWGEIQEGEQKKKKSKVGLSIGTTSVNTQGGKKNQQKTLVRRGRPERGKSPPRLFGGGGKKRGQRRQQGREKIELKRDASSRTDKTLGKKNHAASTKIR